MTGRGAVCPEEAIPCVPAKKRDRFSAVEKERGFPSAGGFVEREQENAFGKGVQGKLAG